MSKFLYIRFIAQIKCLIIVQGIV